MTTNEMYQQLGISPEVLDFGQRVLDGLDEEMSRVDDTAEYNQAKVLSAMHKNRLNATHFNLSSGYGYDDEGRDNLERVYADVFTRRRRWSGPRSPAAPMRWHWRWGPTSCRATSC